MFTAKKLFPDLPDVVIYTRHPECEHNVDSDTMIRKGVMNWNSPLTEFGEKQRDITARYVLDTFPNIDSVFCSEFIRTHELPKAAGWFDRTTQTRLLNERANGVWHWHPSDWVHKNHPDEQPRHQRLGSYHYGALNGGETLPEGEARFVRFCTTSEYHRGTECLWISGHGLLGLCGRKVMTDARASDLIGWLEDDRLIEASVSVFVRDGMFYRCEVWNHVPWKGKIDEEMLSTGTVEA